MESKKPATERLRAVDVIVFAFGSLLQQGLTLATAIWVARVLGPGDFGTLSLARNILGVLTLVVPLGLDVALLRFLAIEDVRRPARFRQIPFLRLIVAVVSVSCVLISGVLGTVVEAHVYKIPEFAYFLLLSLLVLPLAADASVLSAVFRAAHKPLAQAIIALYVQPLTRTFSIVVLLWLGFEVPGVLLGTLFGYVVGFISFQLAARRVLRGQTADAAEMAEARCEIPGLLAGGLWMAVSLLVYGAMRSIDVLVLGLHVSTEEVGRYSALSAVAQVIFILPQALSQTLGPAIARMHADADTTGLREALSRYLRHAALLGAPVFAGIAVFGPWLDLILGSRFLIDGHTAFWLALGYYLSSVLAPMGFSLSMTGRYRLELAILSAGFLAVVIMSQIAAPRLGGLGVALAVCGGYALINIARLAAMFSAFRLLPGSFWDLAPPVVALLIMGAARGAAEEVLPRTFPIAIGVGLTALIAVAAVFWILLLTDPERETLRGMMRRLRSGARSKRPVL